MRGFTNQRLFKKVSTLSIFEYNYCECFDKILVWSKYGTKPQITKFLKKN